MDNCVISLHEIVKAAKMQCNCIVGILSQAFVRQELSQEWEILDEYSIQPTRIYIQLKSGEAFSWTLLDSTHGRGTYYRPAEGDLKEKLIVWGYDN